MGHSRGAPHSGGFRCALQSRPPTCARPGGHEKSKAAMVLRPAAARPQGGRGGRARARRPVRQSARDLAGGARAARQHRHLDREPAAGRGGVSAIDRRRAGDRAHLRGASRADHPVRHRHLARRPRQRAAGRRLDRRPRHEPGAGGARRGSRLRGPARHHPQGAQRIPARPGRVLPDRSRAPTPRSAAWRRRAARAPMRCATAP